MSTTAVVYQDIADWPTLDVAHGETCTTPGCGEVAFRERFESEARPLCIDCRLTAQGHSADDIAGFRRHARTMQSRYFDGRLW